MAFGFHRSREELASAAGRAGRRRFVKRAIVAELIGHVGFFYIFQRAGHLRTGRLIGCRKAAHVCARCRGSFTASAFFRRPTAARGQESGCARSSGAQERGLFQKIFTGYGIIHT